MAAEGERGSLAVLVATLINAFGWTLTRIV
jgi:hypothetical protein